MLNPSIDSFTVMTPFECFDFISPLLDINIHTIDGDTGELLKSTKKPIIYDSEGVKFRVYKSQIFGKDYLCVVYTSKMLLQDYFTGINRETFRWIFNRWCGRYFEIDYQSYLENSLVVDCDFKVDFDMTDSEFHDFLNRYKTVSGSRSFYSSVSSVLDRKQKIGVQLVTRDSASISSPFVKFYSKEKELDSRSSEFKALFLSGVPSTLRRMEVTVINLKHFESLHCLKPFRDLKLTQLNNVLMFSSMAYEICIELLDKHIGKHTPNVGIKTKSALGVTPANYLIFKMIQVLMKETGYSFENCLHLMDDKPDLSPTSRSRLRGNIKDVYKQLSSKVDLNTLRITPKDAFYPK